MKLSMITTLICAGLLSVTATAANAAATQELNVTGNILAETCTFANSGTVNLGDRGSEAFVVVTNVFDLKDCPPSVTLGLHFSGDTGGTAELLSNKGTSDKAVLRWSGMDYITGEIKAAAWNGIEDFSVRTDVSGNVTIDDQHLSVLAVDGGLPDDGLSPGSLIFQGTATVVYP